MILEVQATDQIHNPHDTGYKFLLSNEEVFIELLRNFVPLDWEDNIREGSLLKVDKSYIKRDFTTLEADLVYRLNLKEEDIVFYVLVELQSTVDHAMPVRLLDYMVQIWRDLVENAVKSGKWGKRSHKIPAICPIVLYNGVSP